MYGTVARLRVKPGRLEALKQLSAHESGLNIPGYIAQYLYQMDHDPDEIYLVVMFKDKASYFSNADSPEQNERFQEMMSCLAEEPDWHDGEIVYADRLD